MRTVRGGGVGQQQRLVALVEAAHNHVVPCAATTSPERERARPSCASPRAHRGLVRIAASCASQPRAHRTDEARVETLLNHARDGAARRQQALVDEHDHRATCHRRPTAAGIQACYVPQKPAYFGNKESTIPAWQCDLHTCRTGFPVAGRVVLITTVRRAWRLTRRHSCPETKCHQRDAGGGGRASHLAPPWP